MRYTPTSAPVTDPRRVRAVALLDRALNGNGLAICRHLLNDSPDGVRAILPGAMRWWGSHLARSVGATL